jgi:hypothetical protein
MTIKELSVTSLCLACGFALLPPESARANAPVTVPASVDGSALDAESANSPTIDATNDSTKPASAQKHDFEGTAVRQASGVPGTCPQPPPPAIPACTDLLDPDCLGGLPGEECRPTQVQLVGAQFVATVCDCIAPGDECGPIEVILSGDGIRCPGTCPPPNLPDDCHVHANGVSLGSPDAFVTDPDIPPLAFLTCECTEPVVVCPLPGDPAVDPCANLQSTDCTDPQAPDEVCRPRCVRFGAAGAFVETCDCRTSAECFADPVSLSCVADCPPDEECSETTTVNPDGSTTLCCDCVPVAGACCFDSDGDGINDDCMQLSIDECAAIGGAFHGAGTPCGGTGSCCLDLDGIPGFEACLPMDALCCADQMGQFTAGGVCLGTGACCFDTEGDGTFDTCSDMDGTCCANAGGVFQGAGTNCLDNPCVPPPDTCPEPRSTSVQPGTHSCAPAVVQHRIRPAIVLFT